MRSDDVKSKVTGHSPVVNYEQGIDIVASRIFSYSGKEPYIATISGAVGKTTFARDVISKVLYNKRGELVNPHDLRREQYTYRLPDYFLVEIHEEYLPVVDMETQKLFHKVSDLNVLLVSNLSRLLNPPAITLEKLLQVFNLIVEKKDTTSL